MEDRTKQIIEAEKTNKDYETRKYIVSEEKQKQITERKPKKQKSIFEIHRKKTETGMTFYNSLMGIYEKVETADLHPNVFIQNQLKHSLDNISLEHIKQMQQNIQIMLTLINI